MTEQERPWGSWKIVHEGPTATVKVLTVNPGCMLSLQAHKQCSEYWQPLYSGLVAYVYEPNAMMPQFANGDSRRAELLVPFRTFYIRQGYVHRLINPTATAIDLVETIVGTYDEDDIERYHDAYGRI